MSRKYTNKEVIFSALDNLKLDIIPKFFIGTAFIAKNMGLSFQQFQKDSEIFVKANIEFSKKVGNSIYDGGSYTDIASQINYENEENIIKSSEDIEKLDRYSIGKSIMIDKIAEKIKIYHKYDKNTPIYVGVKNTPMIVSELFGAKLYYKKLLRDKALIDEVSKTVEPLLFQGLERIAEAGCDIIWLPMPTIGGTCISKNSYVESCHLYSKRFVEKIHQLGMKAIIHTCGNWNDRFDIVIQENADALHLSEAILSDFGEKFGNKVCMIGNISVVDTLLYKNMNQVYQESFQTCIDGCKYGNYIVAPDCGVPDAVKEENVRAMFQASDDVTKKLYLL